METLSNEFILIASEFLWISTKIWYGAVCMSSLSTFQSNGHKKKLPRKILILLSFQSLVDESKTVASEKLDYQDISKLTELFHLWSISSPFSLNKTDSIICRDKPSASSKKLDWHLEGEMNQVELKKYEFDNRRFQLTALSGIFGRSRFYCMEKTATSYWRIAQVKKNLHWYLEEKTQVKIIEQKWV